ncbi:MAG: chromate efflux transporter [Chloroflexi bacterium]|nr:chromate efflux transporter [Chloroflexota bacterium]MYK34007.1 chromate efflux transporter [Chloroflexota bacterium]
MRRISEVLLTAGWLGLTSFGGPVAHIGYFREAYVVRKRWLDEETFAGLVALCQFLPGPVSSQLGIAIGIRRAGLLGGFAAWFAFTLPSAAALILFSYGVQSLGDQTDAGWLHGLKVVAVAVVALALWGMARTLAPDKPRITIAAVAAIALLAAPGIAAQLAVIAGGGLLGLALLRADDSSPAQVDAQRGTPWLAVVALLAFVALLVALPVAARVVDSGALAVADSFYRAGSLVFGGGHVVLPLLEAEVVPPDWVTKDEFIAGYGAAQAVPGPLFTFAGYLGAAMEVVAPRWLGGLLALGAIFLPSFFLVVGVLPFWERLRGVVRVRRALMGVNAAVVGLLLAALYDPVWTSAVRAPEDFALAVGAFALLAFWRVPPWAVVALAAGAGALLAAF